MSTTTTQRFRGPVLGDSIHNLRPNTKRQVQELPDDCLPIIALDPGGTLGYSLLVLPRRWLDGDMLDAEWDVILGRKKLWEHGELQTKNREDLVMYRVGKLFDAWPSAAVVIESFTLRPGKAAGALANDPLSPVRQIGILRHHLWRTGRQPFLQDPSFKSTMHDDRLKLWRVHVKEKGMDGHALDADRHALMFLRRVMMGQIDRSVAWPHIYGETEEE